MFKTLLYSLLFSFCFLNAQTTIFDDPFDNLNGNLQFELLANSNLFFISKCDAANSPTSYYTYDSLGEKKLFFQSSDPLAKIISSNSENAFFGSNFSEIIFAVNGKTKILSKSEFRDTDTRKILNNPNFTSKYEFSLRDKKDKFDFNFEKDDVYLSVTDVQTRKKQSFKLQKPNLDRLIGPDFIKPKENLGVNFKVNFDESIDLITKSISKDYSKTILYKTRLSNDGKVVNEVAFELSIPNYFFIYSRNNGGEIGTSNNPNSSRFIFTDDLSINNYWTDSKTGDIYIYGLFSDESSKLNSLVNALGYYIFKFDKSGKKIWQSINKINDSDFNHNHYMMEFYLEFAELCNNVCLNIRIDDAKFNGFAITDKLTGSVSKFTPLNFIKPNSSVILTKHNRYRFNSSFKNFKKKEFNFNSVIAYNSNPKFSAYINNFPFDKDVTFYSFFSDKGIWLFELSQDDKHQKLTLFSN